MTAFLYPSALPSAPFVSLTAPRLTCPLKTTRAAALRQTRTHHWYHLHPQRSIVSSVSSAATTRLVPLPTALKMEVVQMGPQSPPTPEKPPIVFVHGSMHAAWCYTKFFQPWFSERGYLTYAISLRGAGQSVELSSATPDAAPRSPGITPATPVPLQQHLDDFAAFMQETEWARAPVVVGHSIGGFIVQKWAARYATQGDVAGLVLLASSPPSGNSAMVRRIAWKVGPFALWRMTMGFVRRTVMTDVDVCREMFFSARAADGFDESLEGDEVLREYMGNFATVRRPFDVKAVNDGLDGTGGVADGRVLALGGSADLVVDEEGVRESATFWKGEAVLLEGAPHDMMLYSGWRKAADTIDQWITRNVLE